MIDNFEQFQKFNLEDDEFFFILIIQRSKDGRELGVSQRRIRYYCADNFVPLERYRDEITTLCNNMNARAYIYYSPRNYKDVHIGTISELAVRLKDGASNRGVGGVFASVCCKSYVKDKKAWIVDIDEKSLTLVEEVRRFIEDECAPLGSKIFDMVETKNGYHLISKPFSVECFNGRYPEIYIQKSSQTILYIP